ncbi:hypothetical protein Hdeb2414_s0010g00346901 [Helianthus debilis subsp. tardiflorus]
MVTSDSKTWWTWCTRRRFSSEHLIEVILSEAVTDTAFLLPEIFALEEMKHANSKDGKMLNKPFLDVCK